MTIFQEGGLAMRWVILFVGLGLVFMAMSHVSAGVLWSQKPEDHLQARHEIYMALESLKKARGGREVDNFIADWVMSHQRWMQEKFEAHVTKTRYQ